MFEDFATVCALEAYGLVSLCHLLYACKSPHLSVPAMYVTSLEEFLNV